MPRLEVFTMRVTKEEKEVIEKLGERLERTQSDAVRLIIKEAAKALLEVEVDSFYRVQLKADKERSR